MANECAYASPASVSDGENKENRQEPGVIGSRSSEMRYSLVFCVLVMYFKWAVSPESFYTPCVGRDKGVHRPVFGGRKLLCIGFDQ